MKKTLHHKLSIAFLLFVTIGICTTLPASAQQRKIHVSGFNEDVIADADLNASPDSLVTAPVDAAPGNAFFAQGYSNNGTAYTNGLPANGIILSPTGHYYQLAPYDSNNVLNLASGIGSALSFSPQDTIPYDTLFVLATSGSGASNMQYRVYFADGSMETGSFTINDWFCNGCSGYAINNLSRISVTDGSDVGGTFAIYEIPLVIANANRSKTVVFVYFNNSSEGNSFANIFGMSGTSASVLPVTLQYFNTSLKNGQVLLQWKTGLQQNTTAFIIERANAAFPNSFVQVGKVAASSSANGSSYLFANTPGIAGTYLYRLTEQDVDGNKKILGVRSVTFSNAVKWLVQDIGVQWKLVTSSAYHYRLMDLNGKLLQVSSGSGTTTINKPAAKGIYLLQVFTGGESATQKLIN